MKLNCRSAHLIANLKQSACMKLGSSECRCTISFEPLLLADIVLEYVGSLNCICLRRFSLSSKKLRKLTSTSACAEHVLQYSALPVAKSGDQYPSVNVSHYPTEWLGNLRRSYTKGSSLTTIACAPLTGFDQLIFSTESCVATAHALVQSCLQTESRELTRWNTLGIRW